MEGIIGSATAWGNKGRIMPTVPYSGRRPIRLGLRAAYPVALRVLFVKDMFISLPTAIPTVPFSVAIPEEITTHTLMDSSSLGRLNWPCDASVGMDARLSATTIDMTEEQIFHLGQLILRNQSRRVNDSPLHEL